MSSLEALPKQRKHCEENVLTQRKSSTRNTEGVNSPWFSEWILMDTACQVMLSSKWLKRVHQQLNAPELKARLIWRKETLNRAVKGSFILTRSVDII